MIKDLLLSLFGMGVEKIEAFQVKQNNIPVLDIRSKNAFKKGHIPGAFNIPYSEFKVDHPQLKEFDKDDLLAVNCVSGISSIKIVKALNEAGYNKAKSLKGGIKAWKYDLKK